MADSFQIGTVVPPGGELDINARDDLRTAILDALATGSVVVDLSDVTFIDSEALGALIDGYNAATSTGAEFRVINARGAVARVLSVSGSQELFDS